MANRALLIVGLVIGLVLVQSIGWALSPEGGQPSKGDSTQVMPEQATPAGVDQFSYAVTLVSIGGMVIAASLEWQHRKRQALEHERRSHEQQLSEPGVVGVQYENLSDISTGSGLLKEVKAELAELQAVDKELSQHLSMVDDEELKQMKLADEERARLSQVLQQNLGHIDQKGKAICGKLEQLEARLIGRV